MDIRKLSMQNTLTCKSHLLNKTDMRRKLFFITLSLLLLTLPARAVLQEDSLKNSLSISFVYSFMRSMNTLSTVIFLISPEWNLASVNIMSLANQGFLTVASATAVGMMLTIFATFGLAKLVLREQINIFDL